MIQLLHTLSQSSLQDYADCPRRFELRYIRQLAYPAVESEPALENEKHQMEGEYFHRMVQQHLSGIPADRVGRLANSENLKRWWDHYLISDELMEIHRRVKQARLAGILAETTLSSPLGNYRLAAKYDLLFVDESRAVIFDWKTYRKRPKNEVLHARWQTRIYRALLGKAGAYLNNGKPFPPEQIEMVYWFSDFPSDPARFAYRADQFQRDWDTLNQIAHEIFSASTFPKTETETKCKFCPYRSYCDRGVQAGQTSDIEIEGEAQELFDLNFEQIGELAF